MSPRGERSSSAAVELSGTGRELETYVPGYWLSHCEGFRVDDQDGPLGFVERIDNRGRTPVGLIVAENRSGGRRHYVPILHVAVVQPVRERVALDTSLADS